MKKSFRKGQVVKHGTTVILVTGPGNKKEGYPCFSGVVICDLEKGEGMIWPVGTYSTTWYTDVFDRIPLSLSATVEAEIL